MLRDQDGGTVAGEGHPLDDQHRALGGHTERLGIRRAGQGRTDGLRGPTEGDRQQLLERCPLDRCLRQFGAEVLPAPHRDPGERTTIGKIHAPDFQRPGPQHGLHVWGRVDELEVGHSTLRRAARPGELSFDRVEGVQGLTNRVGGHEPAETLPGVDEALAAKDLQRLSNGHSTSVVRRAEGRLRRKNFAWSEFASSESGSDLFGDLLIANRPHLYYGCITLNRNRE